jgi:hypothetical protein
MASDSETPPPRAQEGPGHEPAAEPGRLVGSPHAVAAHDAVLALTKAARCFTLYDPANEVVRKLIGEYREKTRHVLDTFGPLTLAVHPFELRLGDETVYKDPDRERSLAFRLFRDGVRQLHVEAHIGWAELVRLLQILSIRYTAVRQQEDDLVTLLRKAGFEHLRISAIEGYVPEEEQREEGPTGTHHVSDERREPPADWDLPLPDLEQLAPLRFRPVPEELLERLRSEEVAETAAPEAVRVSLDLLALGTVTGDLEAETRFALEAREFLLVEERTDLVVEMARGARSTLATAPRAAESFVNTLLDRETLAAVVRALPDETTEVPPPLAEVLQGASAELLGRLVDLLIAEAHGPRAALLRRLVAQSCGLAPGIVVERLRGAGGAAKVGLLQLLAEIDPAAGLQAALEATTAEEPAVQMEALRQLGRTEFTPEVARALRHLVESASERVRLSALPVMAERGGSRVAPTLFAHAEKGRETLSTQEANATGRALARAASRAALDRFGSWLQLRSAGLLGRRVTLDAPAPLQRVVLAGLERIGGEEADDLLERLAENGDEEVAAEAEKLLESRAGGKTSE